MKIWNISRLFSLELPFKWVKKEKTVPVKLHVIGTPARSEEGFNMWVLRNRVISLCFIEFSTIISLP